MEAIVERIENSILVLELSDGSMIKISKSLLPDAKEGDVVVFAVDNKKTIERKEKINERMNKIWKD